MTESTQQIHIDATLMETQALRRTPAGIAALNFSIQHSSLQNEAGGQRTVQFEMQCICLGSLAEEVAQLALGQQYRFIGFLAPIRKSAKTFKLHVTKIAINSHSTVPLN